MQTKFGWKNLVELLGIVSIVASLTFVGLQVRQSQQIGINETYLMFAQSTIEANSQISEYASIWVAGVSGEKLDATEALIFENLVHNLNELVYFNSVSQDDLTGEVAITNVTVQDFAAFLHRNPGARKVWELREDRLAWSRTVLALDSNPYTGDRYVNQMRVALHTLDDTPPH